MIGRRLGNYEILEKIGEGGMGAVYAALDHSLERKVALKLLPEEMASDPRRYERFQREAKAVAALNHPNVVTIHSVEEADGIPFLTMELVDGRPLDRVIPSGGLPLARVFEIAVPLAEAVAVAHDQGIVHRDLKPANVMVSDEGRVKVLDFGLAKLAAAELHEGESQLPTEAITAEGKILGTVPYMSPEQVQGRGVDHRTDIFSLGVLLYEMCTGIRPFQGESSVDLISSILRDDPVSVTDLKGTLPRHLSRIVRHCLAKDPDERFQTARDVRNELRGLQREIESGELQGGEATTETPSGSRWARPGRWIAGGGTILVLGLLLWLLGFPRSSGPATETGTDSAPANSTEAGPEKTRESADRRTMIVVLPFENLGPAEDEYFADGISQEINSRLASLDGLGTISRASAHRYKGNRPPTAELGEALGVDYILEGTVRWARREAGPSRVRVTPELIRVSDDTTVWSARYDEELDRIFQVQSAIAEAVARQLDLALLAGDREALKAKPTEDMEAYQAYLRAMELWNQPGVDRERFELSAELFQRAVHLDPEFLQAWTTLSQVYDMLWFVNGEDEWRSRAGEALERAEALDPDHVETIIARGYYHYLGFQEYETALAEFRRAEAMEPNDFDVLEGIAYVYRRMEEHLPEAEEYLRRALRLDPQNAHVTHQLARTIAAQRRFEEAEPVFARAIALAPQEGDLWESRARARYLQTGDPEAARRILDGAPGIWKGNEFLVELDFLDREWSSALDRIALRTPGSEASWLEILTAPLWRGLILERLDRPREAERAFREALETSRQMGKENPDSSGPWILAAMARAELGEMTAALEAFREGMDRSRTDSFDRRLEGIRIRFLITLGRHDEAIDRIETMIEEQYASPWTQAHLRTAPWFDPLREDPRFQALIDG